MNFRPFKVYRVYLKPLNSSNVGDFSWIWILKGFILVQVEKENLSSYVHVLSKTSHREVSGRSRAVTSKGNLRWLPRVFTNNPSYLAYVRERNLVTLSLRFCSRDSPLRLPI